MSVLFLFSLGQITPKYESKNKALDGKKSEFLIIFIKNSLTMQSAVNLRFRDMVDDEFKETLGNLN